MDRNGNLFFATIKPLGIACWDSTTPYTANNLKLVVQDNLTLQFVSGLKIVTRNNVQELWVLSCKFQVRNTYFFRSITVKRTFLENYGWNSEYE